MKCVCKILYRNEIT